MKSTNHVTHCFERALRKTVFKQVNTTLMRKYSKYISKYSIYTLIRKYSKYSIYTLIRKYSKYSSNTVYTPSFVNTVNTVNTVVNTVYTSPS